jgi:hypothetical protein
MSANSQIVPSVAAPSQELLNLLERTRNDCARLERYVRGR